MDGEESTHNELLGRANRIGRGDGGFLKKVKQKESGNFCK